LSTSGKGDEMSRRGPNERMPGRSLLPVEYQGELVALASADRFHIVAPSLAARAAGDAELRFVAYMCLCVREISLGNVYGPFSSALAERWARAALVDEAALAQAPEAHDAELAALWRVPLEQLKRAREDARSGE
jgi:hypothetical protein